MDDDTPNTQAPAVKTHVITVPTHWTDIGHGQAVLPVMVRLAQVIDFYPEPTP